MTFILKFGGDLEVETTRLDLERSSQLMTVASLGWVSPGGQLRVSPLYFLLKTDDLFNHHRLHASSAVSPLFIFFWKKLTTFFAQHCHFYYFYSGVTPYRVSPRIFFLPVRPRLSTILSKFAHKFFFILVSPLEGVTRGGPPALP